MFSVIERGHFRGEQPLWIDNGCGCIFVPFRFRFECARVFPGDLRFGTWIRIDQTDAGRHCLPLCAMAVCACAFACWCVGWCACVCCVAPSHEACNRIAPEDQRGHFRRVEG